ncbi:isocitrate lyase/phosphoenolpyruvate mutase family protein [Streptomyces sp. TLI_171]|uniref:isocitrate lyase/PEP mutase family protein n=1 Tax=Streptomyces sp. TLI_171 TaxID=1938859 RepID=UPI000C190212|nr:isocitrate lyase/phosphoenolpyruvate mutase family protein [Streptomyces sp. TLI_171]RKE19948.1 2-methylisocitrate lyase-like PEP mutase family enzyme [Streptomyces sp. TLI_171]
MPSSALPTRSTELAHRLRALSAAPAVLVLPNAWDAGSAAVIAAAGAQAVATTSGGVSWSAGRGDGHGLDRAAMAEAVRRIVVAVDVPVTADVEGGYGAAPEDVAATVRAVVEAGAVGINLEDSTSPGGPLFPVAEQAARLAAARAAAVAAGLPELLINARTDVHLFGIGAEQDRPADVLRRAEAYAAAGADSLFVPGLVDLVALKELTDRSPLPVNAMAVPGGPTVTELAAAGVRRISLGTALAQAAYTAAHRAAVELLGPGTLGALDGTQDYGTLNALFSGR